MAVRSDARDVRDLSFAHTRDFSDALSLNFNLYSEGGRLGFPVSGDPGNVRYLMFAKLSRLLKFGA